MVGPFGSMIRAVSKAAGTKIGKQVSKDVNAARGHIRIDHRSDFTDLINKDSGVSQSWLEGLIKRSNTPEQIKIIKTYLAHPDKTYNLPSSIRKSLSEKLSLKLQSIEYQSFLNRMIENKDKILDLLDHLN